MSIFSTREIVSAIYIAIILIFFNSSKERLNAFGSIIKAIFAVPFLKVYLKLIAFIIMMVIAFSRFSVWKWIYLKDITLWFCLTGIPTILKDNKLSKKSGSLKELFLQNFTLTAVTEIILGYYTFPILVELIMQPIVCLIWIISSDSKALVGNSQTEKLFNGMIVFIGSLLIILTTINAIKAFKLGDLHEMAVGFCLPILLSVMAITILYMRRLSFMYREILFRIKLRNVNKETFAKKKRQLYFKCGVSLDKLIHFNKMYSDYIKSVQSLYDDERFWTLFEKSYWKDF